MKCPVDDSPLSISSREGIEIDFCPQCRGVWLDRGELDKIIDRTAESLTPPAAVAGRSDYDRGYDDDRRSRSDERRRHDDDDRRYRDDDDDDARYRQGSQGHGKRKKRSFLSDLFEFGGEGED